jgi:hypothetical protein
MKKVALFFILALSLLVYGCNTKSLILFNKNDFLRTFNIRMEEEKLNYYMLVSLDQNKKGNRINMIGFNKNQDLEIVLTFNDDGTLIKFGLLTNKIPEKDLNIIIDAIKISFINHQNYTIKEGISVETGYKGIGYFLKTDN